MRLNFLLALAMLTMLFGCKKDEDNNSPQGPSGPTDTWVRVLEADSANEIVVDVAEMTDGGFIMVGSFSSTIGQGNYALKVNDVGDTLWSRHYPVNGPTNSFQGVLALADGGALAVGFGAMDDALLIRMNESGGMVWQQEAEVGKGITWNVAQTSDGNFIAAANGGLFKFNANGDTIWTRTYGDLSFFGVIALSDGGAIATGNHYIDTENAPATVLRCNAQGDSLWSHEFPLSGMRMYPWDIVRTGDGDYVTAGQFEDFPSGDLQGGWAAKFSESGQVRWSDTYGDNEYFYDLATGPDGLPVIVGGIEHGSGDNDILLVKLNNSGSEVWTKTFLSALDESGYALTATSDGGFLIAGIIGRIPYTDIILIKVDENGEN